jgi:putative FmdB family regulatory protein
MPIYEYRCSECTDLFEKRLSFSESASGADCPGCGARASKLLSTFAAIGSAGGTTAGATTAASGPTGGGCCGGGACGAQ